MKVDVTYKYSKLVPFMISDIETSMDSRFCVELINYVDDSQGFNVFPRFVYVFKKDEKSSKPVTYSFHHVLIEQRCEAPIKTGRRCKNTVLEDQPRNMGHFCRTHMPKK